MNLEPRTRLEKRRDDICGASGGERLYIRDANRVLIATE